MNHITSVGLDVHARSIKAVAFNPFTGEVDAATFPYDAIAVAEWIRKLDQPAKAVYESGVTGFDLAKKLDALGIDVVVGEAGAFAYRGEQAHDGYYLMTYHPKSGRAADADRRGKSMIVTGGDRITLTGTAVSTTIPRFPNCCTSRIRSVGFGAVTAKMRVQLSHAATKRRAGGGTNSSIGFMPTIRAPHANAH